MTRIRAWLTPAKISLIPDSPLLLTLWHCRLGVIRALRGVPLQPAKGTKFQRIGESACSACERAEYAPQELAFVELIAVLLPQIRQDEITNVFTRREFSLQMRMIVDVEQ